MFRLVLVSAIVVYVVTAYPRGAPNDTCDSLMPGHGRLAQNKLQSPVVSPYTIRVNGPLTISNVDGTVDLTLEGEVFKGFVIVAEAKNNQNVRRRVGYFTSTGEKTKQACSDKKGLTHNSGSNKSSLQITWHTPLDEVLIGNVSFWGSIVQGYNTFWVELQGSNKISVIEPTTTTTRSTTAQQSTGHQSTGHQSTGHQSTGQHTTGHHQSSHAVDPGHTGHHSTGSTTKQQTGIPTTQRRPATTTQKTPRKDIHKPGPGRKNPNVQKTSDGSGSKKGAKTGASTNDNGSAVTIQVSSFLCLLTVMLRYL